MPPVQPPLDEIEFFIPPEYMPREVQYPLTNDNILTYFYQSPFMDLSSNNLTLFNASWKEPDGERLRNNRKVFEETLKLKFGDRPGTEYWVAADPQGPGQGWVIQKQVRSNEPEGSSKLVVRVEGTYYTVANRIYQAPSLLDVLQLRLFQVSSRIQQVLELSRDETSWSPSTGHTYIPPKYKSAKKIEPAPGSRLGTPGPSEQDVLQFLDDPQNEGAGTTDFNDTFFLQSLHRANKHVGDYMDENPLQGGPGSWSFAKTNAEIESARNKAKADAQTAATSLQAPAKPAEGATPATSVAPTPKPVTVEVTNRKGSVAVKGVPGAAKEKRRKSKGLASPTSPTGPTGL
ncbi:MED6 mediator sub complex component-domain-containing protein [Lophiotrema nucula]|uniref:Mediator of RNA polymerase II transcription subunit 6 n=1 Tax=Lophiotrema nucula TaxID=690887 RepID=A0A6A5ZJB2_9PLEO|nr:MED6 mediator sub complex component-domain-containing protein [Lophiotrema nucula]